MRSKRTFAFLLPTILILSFQPKARSEISAPTKEAEPQDGPVPAFGDTTKAVALVTRVKSFGSAGLSVATIARSLQGQSERIETRSELGAEYASGIDIRRHDLKKLFHLNPANKTYTERSLPDVPAREKSSAKKFKRIDCQSQSEMSGPGPETQVDDRTVQLYRVTTKMVCRDKKTGKEIRRYIYREHVWVSNEPLILDPSIDVSVETLYSYDMLAPVETTGFMAILKGRAEIAEESSSLIQKHIQTVLSIPGTPVRRDQVSTIIWKGKEIPFAASDQERSMGWQNDADSDVDLSSGTEGPIVSTTTSVGSLKFGVLYKIPEWVSAVDPAFSKHGGTAKRVDYFDLDFRNPKGLFDVPRQYRKVSP